MDKILHTPRMLFDIRRMDGQTPTTVTPLEHPRIQCCVLADRGGLTCARFCPLKGVIRAVAHVGLCKILSTQPGGHPELRWVRQY